MNEREDTSVMLVAKPQPPVLRWWAPGADKQNFRFSFLAGGVSALGVGTRN